MATLLNIDFGGNAPPDAYALILAGPVAPVGNGLVLRSSPDIPVRQGLLAVTEAPGTAQVDATRRFPPVVTTATLTVTGHPDTASSQATARPPNSTATLAATESTDAVRGVGAGNEGLKPRQGVLTGDSGADALAGAGQNTPRWKGVMAVTEPPSVAEGYGAAGLYSGPGRLIHTESRDLVLAQGLQVYPVSADLSAVNADSIAAFAAKTHQQSEIDLTDPLLGMDLLSGAVDATSLHDRGYVWEVLGSASDRTMVDRVQSLTLLASGPQKISGRHQETGVAREIVTLQTAMPFADAASFSETLTAQLVLPEAEDLAVGTEGLGSHSAQARAEAGRLSDALACGWEARTDEAASFSATLTAQALGETTDRVRSATGLASGNALGVERMDRGVSADRVTQLFAEVTDDLGAGADAVVTIARIGAETQETGGITAALGATLAGSWRCGAAGSLHDALESQWVGALTDALPVSESILTHARGTAALASEGTATTLLAGPLTVYSGGITDALQTTATVSSTLHLHAAGVLADAALAGDGLITAAHSVVVINADTGAVSTYVFTPTVTSLACYQGVLLLAGPDGLYAVDADQDDDGAVVWTLRTGFSNLGTDHLKRIRDVNVLLRTDGETTLQVIADRAGAKQEHTYRLPPLPRASYRDGVVKPGKGLASVYFALGLRGAGPAELDQLRVAVEPLQRRK